MRLLTTHNNSNFSPLNWKLQSSISSSVTALQLTKQDFCLCPLHSWLLAPPSPGLGLHLDPDEIQIAIKRWLGMDTSSGSSCAVCPHNMLDPLGHHAVTRIFGGDVVSRHNQLQDTFVQTCQFAGVSASIEAGSGLGHAYQTCCCPSAQLANLQPSTSLWSLCLVQPISLKRVPQQGQLPSAEVRKHEINDVMPMSHFALGGVGEPVQ